MYKTGLDTAYEKGGTSTKNGENIPILSRISDQYLGWGELCLGLDRNLGFSGGHQWHRPHDDGNNQEEDNKVVPPRIAFWFQFEQM